MTEEQIELDEDDLQSMLLPKLIGRVFHVTTPESFEAIKTDGFIRSNEGGAFPQTCSQSKVSYFRKHGCVSLVDLREISAESLDCGLKKYFFLSPFDSAASVFLILSASFHTDLIPWTVSKDEGLKAMIVPEFEAGFRRALPLTGVDAAIHCLVKRKPRIDYLSAWSK